VTIDIAEAVSNGATNAVFYAATVVSTNKKGATIAMKNKLKKQMTTKPLRLTTATPVLRFSPTAWAKLLFLRDYGETEVGGFGIAADDDLLFVEDVQLVEQTCSWAHVAFDDESVADFFDAQVDAERQPEQFARIWVHTHPGDSPQPSLTDQETFDRVFGRSDWAVMFILAQQGQSYARLRFNVGPGGAIQIPIHVDYSRLFSGSAPDAWEQEYLANVGVQQSTLAISATGGSRRVSTGRDQAQYCDPFYGDDEYAGLSDADPPSYSVSVDDYEDAIERWARDRYPDLHDSEIAAFVAEETESKLDDSEALGWQ